MIDKERFVMRNQGLIYIAILIILAGVALLIGNLFNIDVGAFCFPIGLILIGVFVLLRPRMVGPDTKSHVVLIGDLERSGPGALENEEFWSFVIDASYDLTKYDVPAGETLIRGVAFVSDVEIFVPVDVGLALDLSSFVTSLKLESRDEETTILSPLNWRSDGYKGMERRVRFELTQFVGDVKVRTF
jgi:predicted membrane protein